MSSGLSLSINLYQNRKLTSRPVLRTALHDKATFCEHFQKMEEDFTESFVCMYPSMHIFKPPLLLFIISRRALAREGDYEMMSVCACVCVCVS